MFDINKAVKYSGLSKVAVTHLKEEIKKEFPNDQMLYELYLIRALSRRKKRGPSSRSRVKRISGATLR